MRSIPAFVGRADELDAFAVELDAARAGRPRVILLEGPAGVGKTALVERFVATVGDARILHASGEESESDIELAMLDQLLRRSGAGGLTLEESGHVHAGTRLLDALGELQAGGTGIVVIDDAQWADGASMRALLFAIRRLVSDCLLLFVVVREGSGSLPEGLRKLTGDNTVRHIRLEPLALPELQRLADSHGVTLSSAAVRRLHEHSGGNPLYARELLAEVPAGLWESAPGPLPAPRTYAELVLRRLRALPDIAIALAEAASVLGVRSSLAVAAQVGEVDEPHAAVDALGSLVEGTGLELRFVHPLVQSAIYRGMNPSRRAALHLRAAALTEDTATALNHRFAAAAVPDADLARELAAFAAHSSERQRWSTAAWAFELAGEVSPDRAGREERHLAATEAAMFAGDSPRARRLASVARAFEPSPRLDAVLAYVAIGTGQRAEAEERLRRAWVAGGEDARVAERLAFLGVLRLRADEAVEWALEARSLTTLDDPVIAPTAAWLATGLHWLGRSEEAYAVLDEQRTRFGRGSGAIRGTLLLADGRAGEAAADLAREEASVLPSGSLIVAGRLLAKHAQARFALGEWDDAVTLAHRAQAYALESDDVSAQAIAGAAAALVPAARGDHETCERLRLELEALPAVFEAHVAERDVGLATLAAARGDHAAVLRILAPLAALDAPFHYPWAHLYGEALVRLGRPEADEFLDDQQARGRDDATRARLARVRGELELLRDDHDAALTAFARAGDLVAADAPYERALIDFGHGRALRRARRRRVAADRLARARDTFAALGALRELGPCERELSACGLTPAKRGPDVDRSRLTPQERSVAQIAATGKSNREIAAELLISVKSVERYLTQVYRKLGVTSRAGLTHVRSGEDPHASE
ncbi:ATP-binding protein [Solirubrobacter soli]|uniref:ATP-binding protein n=1 Tax=Solirubrobacter soli TaxID=363832 RepID=UPI00041279B0|nr:LuxR family transcriptional regulator [Solirubrobacter soli]